MVHWRPVQDFPDYEVSTLGSVRSLPRLSRQGIRLKGCTLKPQASGAGYCKVTLHADAQAHQRYVHVVVLHAFKGRCPEGSQACHRDGNPRNNKLRNLRWDTPYNNHADRKRHGRVPFGSAVKTAKLTECQVRRIRTELQRGYTQRYLAQKYSVSEATLSRIASRKVWKHV